MPLLHICMSHVYTYSDLGLAYLSFQYFVVHFRSIVFVLYNNGYYKALQVLIDIETSG